MVVAPVVELGPYNRLRSWEQALRLSDRHEPDAELERRRSSENEPARLDSGDLRGAAAERVDECEREFAQQDRVVEQAPNVGMPSDGTDLGAESRRVH
jgi:hypothetical protein